MKYCNKCSTEKPKTDFGKCQSKKDGLQSNCKACKRDYKIANKEKISAQSRAYCAANKDARAEYAREYYVKNAERILEVCRAYKAANIESRAKYNRAYNAAHAERISDQKRGYRAANADRCAERSREYYSANADSVRKAHRAYRLANPDKMNAIARNRRAMQRGANGSHTAEEVKAIFDAQRGKCATCETRLFKSGKKKFHADHIVPLIKGGDNDKYNIQCLCPTCNLRKNDKDPFSWAKQHGKLL